MKQHFILIVLFALLVSCGNSEHAPKTAQQHFESAQMYLDLNQPELAYYDIEDAIGLDSTKPEYYELRAEIHFLMHDTVGFEDDFQHALLMDSTDAVQDSLLREMIRWDIAHDNQEQAYELIEKELALYADDEKKHLEVIDFAIREFQEMHDEDAAKKLAKSTIRKHPKYALPHERLAMMELHHGNYSKAASHFKHYVAINDTNVNVLCNLGYCYVQIKNKSRAKKYYKMAVDLGSIEACEQYRELTAKTRYYSRSKCCDGTTSSSTGRGACSHHGGVCRVEQVPYKEYTWECK